MSEPPHLRPSAAGVAIATRALTSVTNELTGRLRVGMQVELIPTRSLGPELIEARLRPLADSAAWSHSVQARLTTTLPTQALQVAAGDRPAAGASPLRAEVVATSPTLVLKLVADAERATPVPLQAAAAGSREWLGQQFRQHWPESRPLAATLEHIAAAMPETRTDATHAPQIRRAVTTLLDQLATVTELTDPDRLAIAVSRSGVWLEALLAQSAIDPAHASELGRDLKAQLLTLAQRIRQQGARSEPAPPSASGPDGAANASVNRTERRPATFTPTGARVAEERPQLAAGVRAAPAPPSAPTQEAASPARPADPEEQRLASLARDVEGMLKQVVTKQLQSLDSPAGQTQWLLELPFRTPSGLLALEADIRREREREHSTRTTWSLRLRLDLPKLGPLHILLTLRDERLNASLQAANRDGAEQIGQHLGELRARLEAREIDVAGLHAGQRPLAPPTPPFADPLVREQA